MNIEHVNPDTLDLLLYSRVQSGDIGEDIFKKNLETAESNPAFLTVLRKMRANKAMAFMYSQLVAQGPEAILGVVSMLVESGVVDKKDVTAATKSTKPKSRKAYYKSVLEDLSPAFYEAACAIYKERVEGYRAEHGDVIPDELGEFLKSTGKASLSNKVSEWTHPKSGVACPLSLSWRVDYNAPSRNGTAAKKEEAVESAE